MCSMAEEKFHAEVIGWCRNGSVTDTMCLPEGARLSEKLCGGESVRLRDLHKSLGLRLRETADDKDHGRTFSLEI